MKTIIISEESFKKIFESTLKNLQFETLIAQKNLQNQDMAKLQELHRKFHYELCCLKDNLEKG